MKYMITSDQLQDICYSKHSIKLAIVNLLISSAGIPSQKIHIYTIHIYNNLM